MVGPVPDSERRKTLLRLKVGFVLLVGLSGALITSQGNATLIEVAAVTLGGTGLGLLLVWIVFPDAEDLPSRIRRRGRQ